MGFSGGFQRTVNVVNPTVIGANIRFAVPGHCLANPRAPMATDVVHRGDFTGFSSRDDNRVLANLNKLVVAGGGNLAGVKRVNPALENQMFELLLMHEMRAIKIGVHRMVRPALLGLQLVTHARK